MEGRIPEDLETRRFRGVLEGEGEGEGVGARSGGLSRSGVRRMFHMGFTTGSLLTAAEEEEEEEAAEKVEEEESLFHSWNLR